MSLEVKLFIPRRVVRRGDSKFELMSEGELWGLYEPILR